MSPLRFVLASFNPDKARELRALFALPELELVPVVDWPGAVPPLEDGATLLDNARIKARAALTLTGLAALADDTGLEVDALAGAPGVHSARFAGPNATAADNIERLLRDLADIPETARTARFRTVCVAVFPDGRERVAEGVLEGRIARECRGNGGFGYDPVFELPDGRMLAELTDTQKNAISHRGGAVKALAAQLREAVV
ncbi:MAG: RdgB/HAM1 family non-canonical purine NTP pyrophosphatase [Candidatus Eisenbacteria bacterium]